MRKRGKLKTDKDACLRHEGQPDRDADMCWKCIGKIGIGVPILDRLGVEAALAASVKVWSVHVLKPRNPR